MVLFIYIFFHTFSSSLDIGFGPFKSKLKTVFNNWHTFNVENIISIYDIFKIVKLTF